MNSAAIDLYPSRLVVDASVTINLLATGVGLSVLDATPSPVLMEVRAFQEVRRHPIRDQSHTLELERWQRQGLLSVVSLSAHGEDLLGELDASLDDGEAATIAYAVSEAGDLVPVIDERKATRLFRTKWPDRKLIDTVSLFRSLLEIQALNLGTVRDAVHSALVHARMQVSPEMTPWVIQLIGEERAAECPSLRRSSLRRHEIGGRSRRSLRDKS